MKRSRIGPESPQPDVSNYAWRDYGNRVGVWRLIELFDQLKLPVGVLTNTSLYDYCPEVLEAFVARGDEMIGHGHTNAERQGEMTEADERALLEHCRERIAQHSGKAPAVAVAMDLGEPRTPTLLRDWLPLPAEWCTTTSGPCARATALAVVHPYPKALTTSR